MPAAHQLLRLESCLVLGSPCEPGLVLEREEQNSQWQRFRCSGGASRTGGGRGHLAPAIAAHRRRRKLIPGFVHVAYAGGDITERQDRR
jgi:hypothetical protein